MINGDDRNALLLTARLLESGVTIPDVELPGGSGHVGVALALVERLRAASADPENGRQIIDALRTAARERVAA